MVPKSSPNESRESPRDQVIRRKRSVVRTLLACVTIINVLIFAYVGSVIYSVSKTSVVLDDTSTYTYNLNNVGDPGDDTIDYYLNLSISNQGFYAIQAITLHIDVYVHNSTNEGLVPSGTHFGNLTQVVPAVLPGNVTNLTLTLANDAAYSIIFGMKLVDVWLRIEFTIDTGVQQFPLHVAGKFFQPFDSGY